MRRLEGMGRLGGKDRPEGYTTTATSIITATMRVLS